MLMAHALSPGATDRAMMLFTDLAEGPPEPLEHSLSADAQHVADYRDLRQLTGQVAIEPRPDGLSPGPPEVANL
jgi:hypothetical protein